MDFSADCKPKKYCWRDLELLTNFFSEENFIGKINFGKVYRGKTQQGQEVTVKIWLRPDVGRIAKNYANYGLTRLEVRIYITHVSFIYYLLPLLHVMFKRRTTENKIDLLHLCCCRVNAFF